VGLAEVAHAGTDGCGSVLGLLLALGLAWPAAVAVLGVRRRVPVLLLWLAATQVVLHVLLESRCDEVLSGRQGVVAHLSSPPSGRVLLAHGLAVVVSALLLGRAEAGMWAADAVRRSLRVGVPVMAVVVPVVRARLWVPVLPLAQDVWRGPRPARRGPPALTAP